jgi:hypothetical protein
MAVPESDKQKHSGKLAPSQIERGDREIAATDPKTENPTATGVYGSDPGLVKSDALLAETP